MKIRILLTILMALMAVRAELYGQDFLVTTEVNPALSGTATGGGSFASGTSVTVTAIPETGYDFVNWTENNAEVSSSPSYNFTVTANRSLIANFSLKTYSITTTAVPDAGGSATGGGTFNHGAFVTVTATPANGYSFINWTEEELVVSTDASYLFAANAGRTLIANFSLNTYSITTSAVPSAGGTTTGGGTFNHGASVTVTAIPSDGYSFINWTEEEAVVSDEASYLFTANTGRTLNANFRLNIHSITASADPDGSGTVSGSGNYNHGSSATVTAIPSNGYFFVNWTESGSVVSTDVSYTFPVNSDRILVANFSPVTFTITTSSNPVNGGISVGGGIFNLGATATLIATPFTGYQFVNWSDGGTVVSTDLNYSFIVSSNRNLIASFQSISYQTINILSNPTEGGTTTGAGTYAAGSNITVTANADAGYNFVNWTESGTVVSSSSTYSFTLNADRILVANFSRTEHVVSTSSSPPAGGSTSGGGTYLHGDEATVNATPSAGYEFINWTQGGTSVSTNPAYTFNVNSDRNLTANFDRNAYTITTNSNPSGGGSTTGGGSFYYGDIVTVTAFPATGYNFVNWTQGGSVVSANPAYTFTVTSGRTLVANFSRITFTISLSSNPSAGGTTNGGGTYSSGTPATVLAIPATGYMFDNWTLNGSAVSSNTSYTFTVTGNRSLVANFSRASYTISTSSSPAAGGTTNGGGGFNYGASATVTAVPASGYQFSNWTEGGYAVSSNPSYTFMVSGNRNLIATFTEIPRILKLTAEGGITLSNNDIYQIETPDAGSFFITVEANADWTVSENSLWLRAVKENSTSIRVIYMENISVIRKQAALKVKTALNAEMQILIQQKARISQYYNPKSESIRLYPNPVTDIARFIFRQEVAGKTRISVASMQGTIMLNREYYDIEPDQSVELDISGLKTGNYIVNITHSTGHEILLMIKQ